jgi:rubredoxin
MKCRNCSYHFDPTKEGNSKKGNVECVVLEILIL